MSTRDDLILWMDQFENGHYEFDAYGETVKVDLPRDKVEKVLDISLLLVDRMAAAKNELSSADYKEFESRVRENCKKDKPWQFYVAFEAVFDEKLFGRYKDIESMIAELEPRDYPKDSASYLLMVKIEIHQLIYAVIRELDKAEEDYTSLVYTFFIGVLAKCWGEGFGWYKDEDGCWCWKR